MKIPGTFYEFVESELSIGISVEGIYQIGIAYRVGSTKMIIDMLEFKDDPKSMEGVRWFIRWDAQKQSLK